MKTSGGWRWSAIASPIVLLCFSPPVFGQVIMKRLAVMDQKNTLPFMTQTEKTGDSQRRLKGGAVPKPMLLPEYIPLKKMQDISEEALDTTSFGSSPNDQIPGSENAEVDKQIMKEMSRMSGEWLPFNADSKYFVDEDHELTLNGIQLSMGNVTVWPKTNLKRKVINLELSVGDVGYQGFYTLQLKGAGRKKGRFKSQMKRARCTGTIAINRDDNKINMEWLLVECSNGTEPVTTVSGVDNDDVLAILGKKMNKYIEGDLERGLTLDGKIAFTKVLLKVTLPSREIVLRRQERQEAEDMEDDEGGGGGGGEGTFLGFKPNVILDLVLKVAAATFHSKFQEGVPIPEVKEVIRLQVIFTTIETGLTLRDGRANFTSLNREGDARITRSEDGMLYYAGYISIDKFDIKFNDARVTFLGIGPIGAVSATVKPAVVGLKMRIDENTRKLYLDYLKIIELGDVKVKLKFIGMFLDAIASEMTNHLIAVLKNVFITIVEQMVVEKVREILDKNTLENLATGNIQF